MKKLFVTLSFLIVSIALPSCGDDNDDQNNPVITDPTGLYFNIKAATVVYSAENYSEINGDMKICFDDYGKKFRFEMPESIFIVDEDAKTSYILMPDEKMYMENPAEIATIRHAFMYLGDDLDNAWKNYPTFKKESNKTIAGKNCGVCSWNDTEGELVWGGWNRITFLYSLTNGGDIEQFEAKSFAESADANMFVVPSDYTKFSY